MTRIRLRALCALLLSVASAPVALGAGDARIVTMDQAEVLRDARDGVVAIPAPGGEVERFRIRPVRVVAPALDRKYPGNRVFQGEGIDDSRARVILGTGLQGFHAQVLTPRGDWYTDRRADGRYLTYDAGATAARAMDLQPPRSIPGATPPVARATHVFPRTSGTQLRTYRFALATTGEYSAKFGGTKPLVHAELVKAIARINGIYESEVSARFELVANNDDLIYLNSGTDPYTNNDGVAMLAQNQSTVDAAVGSANYDLGHVFSTGGGGVAYLGVLGDANYKARGVTGMSNPTGDYFWVDYVAHEVGHQMGGNHTFQGDQGACSGNAVSSAAMEPGSGSTIMAYAGICSGDDLQAHSDAYFHAKSYDEIRAEIESVPGVGVATATGNSAPVITLPASSYTVPPLTPLRLAASATDADGDAITYAWEQYNASVIRSLFDEPKSGGALFRSFAPTASGVRFAPAYSAVLAGTTNQATGSCAAFTSTAALTCNAEFLPPAPRAMTFRVTARDDAAGGGGVSTADVAVTVSGSTPFEVTSQNAPQSVDIDAPLTITWDTAGTAGAPYNVSGVDILLSTDGGATWSQALATNTPNDGSHAVSLSGVANGASLRLMVRGTNSIFYDITDAAITAVDSSGPTLQITTPAQGAVYTQGDTVTADFACTDPAGIAICTGTVADGAAIDTATLGVRSFTVTATDTEANSSILTHTYTVVEPPVEPPVSTEPPVNPPSTPPAQTTPAPTPTPSPEPQAFGVDLWVARGLVGAGVIGSRQQAMLSVRGGRTATYTVIINNFGTGPDTVRIAGAGSTRTWRVTYTSAAGGDITRAVTRGGWTPAALAAGAELPIVVVRVTPRSTVRRGAALVRTLTATSTALAEATDAVTLRTVRR